MPEPITVRTRPRVRDVLGQLRRMPAHRLWTRIAVAQLAILVVTGVLGFVLFTVARHASLDHAYEQRAVAIAQAAASDPVIRREAAVPELDGPSTAVQEAAERIKEATHASYVVVIGLNRVRHSHPMPELIGQKINEPIAVFDGKAHESIHVDLTGRSANGRVPLYGLDGTLIGEVSAGIPEEQATDELRRELPTFALYAGVVLAIGCAASLMLARRLKRTTFGLELEEIAGLLQDREAMLHGIKEGVVSLDTERRITVINDEARRLTRLNVAPGARLDEALPDGRLRRILEGSISGSDLIVLTDDHCLVVNRMPVVLSGRELGAVVTVRDRTELVGVLRELDSVRGLTDALRAQQHEFTNRMHTLAGLLELGEHGAALDYVLESAGTEQALAESTRQRIGNTLMVGLIVAKTTVAAERGVRITLTPDSRLGERPPHLRRLLTIIGNLLDNAVEAAADGVRPADGAQVWLSVVEDDRRVVVRVTDTGPGVPAEVRARIFEDGWSTRPDRGTARRGLGLALVHRLVQRHLGTIEVSTGPGAVFTVVLPAPVPDTRRRATGAAVGQGSLPDADLPVPELDKTPQGGERR